ncbi:MAG: TolC family protein [Thermodesulfobacteriota bacterium]
MNYGDFSSKVNGKVVHKAVRALFLMLFAVLLWCACVAPSICQGKETTAPEENVSLSLRQCVELLLTNNLHLKVERYNPYLQEKEIIKEKAVFDPLARLSLQDQKIVVSPSTYLNGVRSSQPYERETIDYEFGLAKKLITGGLGEIKFTTNKFESNSIFQIENPTYHSNIVFSLNQPLLRNFGINLNKSRIIISSNNREISQTKLRDKTIKMITTLQEIYWRLYLSKQVLEVNRGSLQLARDLMERNKALVEVGMLPSVEVLRAQAGVASREEGVILAENAVGDIEDLLKETLDLPFQNQMITLIDKPTFKVFYPLKVEKYLEVAFENRPDHEEAKILLNNIKVANKVAKNAMLPLFDFQASYGINATKGHHDESVHGLDAGGGDYSWLVGFKMEIPLGNRWAKNNYQKYRLEMKKTETSIQSLEKRIELEIREVLREIESGHKRIGATQEARRMAEKNLEAEDERMGLGMSTSVDVLRVQEELVAAQCNESKTIVDYIHALNNLDMVVGTTLETHQIEF